MWLMTEARWRLVVDQDGVTIAGDRYQLTTAPREFAVDDAVFGVTESAEMEAIVAELDSMTRRTYGQYCGISRAMEVLGERWVPLIVRDLLVSPKGYTDLRRGLPRVPVDVLSARLRELEHTGIIRAVHAPDESATDIYEITEYGRELEDIVVRLGRWGARMLGEPRSEDIFTESIMGMTLKSTFRPERARRLRLGFELHILDFVVYARIDNGTLSTGVGPLPDADLVVESGYAIKDLMTGELSAAVALASGAVRVSGDPALFSKFTQLFRLPPPVTARAA
jgi:DNA-binding HxlR family transcriptional regulator